MTDPETLLIGDIGATNIRLQLVSRGAGDTQGARETVLASRNYQSLEEPVREVLRQASGKVTRAVLAVAGPVVQGRAALTNLGWAADEHAMAESLGLVSVRLLNDLVAMAWAVPQLRAEDSVCLQAGQAAPSGTIAVVAPGTGLGEAFLTWDGQAYQAHASEGGHADFAAADETQHALLEHLRTRYGHVSCERVCSGRALPDLYGFLRERGVAPERPEVAARLTEAADQTPVIVSAALAGSDPSPLCRAAVDLFAVILAAEAGNMALRVLATGGVYLAGGIPRRLLTVLRSPAFLKPFHSKGRLSPLLARIPLHVVTRPGMGLLGARHYALRQRLDER